MPLGAGFTVQCITIDASSPNLVGKERLELSILSALASKTRVYTIPPLAQICSIVKYYAQILRQSLNILNADAVISGSVAGSFDPNSVSVPTRYLIVLNNGDATGNRTPLARMKT